MKIEEAKKSLDKVIRKARVHLYKPIQIAEIELEFPATKGKEFKTFFEGRNYHKVKDEFWK